MPVRSLTAYAQTTNMFESKPLGYLELYELYFSKMMDEKVKLLELGVSNGQSMHMWKNYFDKGTIAGLDLFPKYQSDETHPEQDRVKIYQGSQTDLALLDKIAQECAPDGFDIIVDDCSHIGELTKLSFWHPFAHHLKPGGVYAIEDWGTGYWGGYRNPYYPDGEFFDPTERETFAHWLANKILKSAPVEWRETGRLQKLLKRFQYTRRFKGHDYGMVGFVKQLVDEVGVSDYTNPMGIRRQTHPPITYRRPYFAHVLYGPGVVLVTKA